MNIFHSTEIYKRIPNVPPDQNPLRAVRGMYVSGTYLVPYYIDSGITISAINTTKATVSDYTSQSIDMSNESTLNIFDISFSNVQFIEYDKAYETSKDDTLNIFNITLLVTNITDYTKEYYELSNEGSVNIFDIAFSNVQIESYTSNLLDSNNDFLINISSIVTTSATVANYSE